MQNETCSERVDNSRTDYDAHGRFYVRSDKPCGAAVHRIGLCRAHFDDYVRKLRHQAEYNEALARRQRAELSDLTDTTCENSHSSPVDACRSSST